VACFIERTLSRVRGQAAAFGAPWSRTQPGETIATTAVISPESSPRLLERLRAVEGRHAGLRPEVFENEKTLPSVSAKVTVNICRTACSPLVANAVIGANDLAKARETLGVGEAARRA
jgi:hypothetical protein